MAGWVHLAELAVARHLQHHLVWFSRDFAWMAPISYALVLAPFAFVMGLTALFTRSRWVGRCTVFGATATVAFGALLPYSEIARIASLVLALGLALQLTRRGTDWLFIHGRRLAAVATVIVTILALAIPRSRAASAARALATLPPASTSAPNVLLIILDTVRAASMSLYGAPDQTTPHLSAWATDGVTFDQAYSVAPWTLPSHASLFTGRYAGELTADWKTPLDNADSTLAELFRVRGYATGAFMANLHYTAWDTGLDRGFATYDDYRTSWWQLVRSSSFTQTALFDRLRTARSAGDVIAALLHPDLSIDLKHTFDRKYAAEVSRGFLDWQARITTRPFFATLNFFDAHQPYYAPAAFQQFPRTAGRPWRYEAAIAYLDDQLDQIFRSLRDRRQLDRTIVVVTSDHGELFNEHGLTGHAHDLYKNVLHVPLVLRYPPTVPKGVRVTRTTSLRDVPRTILELAGVTGTSIPGQSLSSLWNDSTAVASAALAEVSQAPNVDNTYPTAKGPMKALVDDSTHYIRNGDGREELYRHRDDPSESRNLAATNPTAAGAWRARVDSLVATHRRPR